MRRTLLLILVCLLLWTGVAEAQEAPPAPTNLAASANLQGHVVLSWTAPDDDTLTGYQILRRRPTEGENSLQVYVSDTGSTATTYTDTNVTAGVQHVYRVKAINPAGGGARSNFVNVTPTEPQVQYSAPPAPTNLTASANLDGHIVLTWTAPNDDTVTGYQILRRRPSEGEHSLQVYVSDTGSTATTYTDTNVTAGVQHAYRVKAINPAGGGARSNYANVTPPEPQAQRGAPPAPTGMSATAGGDGVELSWTAPEHDAISGYRIWRGADADSLTVLVSDTAATDTSYSDTTAEGETTYVYAVAALSGELVGATSATVSVTTPEARDAPAAPTGLLTAASDDNVVLAWDNPADADITGYRVLRGTNALNLSVLVLDTGSAATSYLDETIEANTTYHYAVQALYGSRAGPLSNVAQAQTGDGAGTRNTEPLIALQQTTEDTPTARLAVSNLGQGNTSTRSMLGNGSAYRQRFQTGSKASMLSKVQLYAAMTTTITEVRVEIHRWNTTPSGLGMLVGRSIATTFDSDTDTIDEFTFDTALRLNANTEYALTLLVSAAGAGTPVLTVRTTTSNGEDSGGLSDWTIADRSSSRTGTGVFAFVGVHRLAMALFADPIPTVTDSDVLSQPLDGDVYHAGEHIEFSYDFDTPVFYVSGQPEVSFFDTISAARVNARFLGGNGTTRLLFRYTVQPDDRDSNGFQVVALTASSGVKYRSGVTEFDLIHGQIAPGSGHQVNGTSRSCEWYVCGKITTNMLVASPPTLGIIDYISSVHGLITNRTFSISVNVRGTNPREESFEISQLLLRGQRLELFLNNAPSERARRRLSLVVDGKAFPFSEASLNACCQGRRLDWNQSGLSWSADQQIEFSIRPSVLVGNLDQGYTGAPRSNTEWKRLGDEPVAISFTTGDRVGYDPYEIHLQLYTSQALDCFSDAVAVHVHRTETRVGGPNRSPPGLNLGSALVSPCNRVSRGWHRAVFLVQTADLTSNTTYWVTLTKTSTSAEIRYAVTDLTSEDVNRASGFTIGNDPRRLSTLGWNTSGSNILKLELRGYTEEAVNLSYFAPIGRPQVGGVLEVGQYVFADHREISDDNGMSRSLLTYKWGSPEGIPGTDGFTLRGVAGDEFEKNHYRIAEEDVGRRMLFRLEFEDDSGAEHRLYSDVNGPVLPGRDPVMSNIGQPGITLSTPLNSRLYFNALDWFGMRFTTGDVAVKLDSVRIGLATRLGVRVRAAIFEWDAAAARPGAMVAELTQPSHFDGSVISMEEFGADGLELSPSTAYVLGLQGRDESSDVGLMATTTVDAEGRTGWQIEDADPFTWLLGGEAGEARFKQAYWPGISQLAFRVEFTEQVENVRATGAPAITGVAEPGLTLAVSMAGVSDENGLGALRAPGLSQFRWFRQAAVGEEQIGGADEAFYTLQDEDLGKAIRVEVRFRDDDGFEETLTSGYRAVARARPRYLVSNLHQPAHDLDAIMADEDPRHHFSAGSITTGPQGADVKAVRIRGALVEGGEASLVVYLNNSANEPGEVHHRVSGADWSPFVDQAEETVDEIPTPGLTLAANTTYWFTIAEHTGEHGWFTARSGGQDSGGLAGWSVGNRMLEQNMLGWSVWAASWGVPRLALVADTANDAPAFDSDTQTLSVDENAAAGKAVGTITATDADSSDTLTYSLAGPDADDFAIDASTAAITTSASALFDYERKTEHTLWVQVRDSKDDEGAADTAIDDTLVLTVTVNNIDESGTVVPSSNAPETETPVIVDLHDPDRETRDERWQWSRSDAVDGPFTEITDADDEFYTPVTGDDGKYLKVEVDYTDAQGPNKDAELIFARAVGREEQTLVPADTTTPVFVNSREVRSIDENAAAGAAVGTVTAAYSGTGTLTYSVVGADLVAFGRDFTLNSSTGAVSVKSGAQIDYEQRSSYAVTLQVQDGIDAAGNPSTTIDDTVLLTINVNNVDETGTVTLSGATPQVNTEISARLSDPDRQVTGETWQWAWSTSRSGSFTDISGATSSSYTPVAADVGRFLRATVGYADGHGSGKTASAVSVNAVVSETTTVVTTIEPPEFANSSEVRSIAENAAAGASVAAIAATYTGTGTLVYSVSGTDLSAFNRDFTLDTASGAITVKTGAQLDYEGRSSYTVRLSVTDGLNADGTSSGAIDDSVALTINLTNVDEPGEVELSATPRVGEPVDAFLDDPDRRVRSTTWQWSRGASASGPFTDISGATRSVYTPEASDEGMFLKVEASYADAQGSTKTAEQTSPAVLAPPDNRPPEFDDAPYRFEVADTAGAGRFVGQVEATDPDGDSLTFAVGGADAAAFNRDFVLEAATGIITLSDTAELDIDAAPSYRVSVTVTDGLGADHAASSAVDATAEVAIFVVKPTATRTDEVSSDSSGGAVTRRRRSAPGNPSPSELDFAWNVRRDLDALDCRNPAPVDLWSDGETVWVLNSPTQLTSRIFAYALESGEPLRELGFDLDCGSGESRGIWSDGRTLWVSDSQQDTLVAYRLETGERAPDGDLELDPRNRQPRGIWSDGVTTYVLDSGQDRLFAYQLETGELVAHWRLDPTNGNPRGIWSDGITLWVSDDGVDRIFAYRITSDGLERVRREEFAPTPLRRAANLDPRGLWSDGEVMLVADDAVGRIYSYNLPAALDDRLRSLSLSDVEFGEFSADVLDYRAVTKAPRTTIEAVASAPGASVRIEPLDADPELDGRQVDLDGVDQIQVTVTSADGSRSRVYRIEFDHTNCYTGLTEAALSTVTSTGGSVTQLRNCARHDNLDAVYHHDGASWVVLGLTEGFPDFINGYFLERFRDGIPAGTSLLVRRAGS